MTRPACSAGASAPARITTRRSRWWRRPGRWQRRGFGPGEDHNALSVSSTGGSQPAAPGLRPRRGSQQPARRPVISARNAAPGLRPRRGSQPGHRDVTGRARPAAPGLRPRRGSQHPALRPARWTARAAPGLRPRRGSQSQHRHYDGEHGRWQRRGFGPGEDHNIIPVVTTRGTCRRQRRGFGPGEDHNPPERGVASRDSWQRRGFGPGEDHNYTAADDLTGRVVQRRGFGPGEDHNCFFAAP